MFKTKKTSASAKTSGPKKSVVPKKSKDAKKPAAKVVKVSTLAPKKSVKSVIKSGLKRPTVAKSKKGSPLRKRVSEGTGKLKVTLRGPVDAPVLLGPEEPAMKAAQAAIDKKATDILVLDVAEISGLCDRMILCTATSTTHLSAVSDAIEEALRKAGQRLLHSDGRRTAEPEWVLLDYGDLMIHVFRKQARADYLLEEYYVDGKVLAKFSNA